MKVDFSAVFPLVLVLILGMFMKNFSIVFFPKSGKVIIGLSLFALGNIAYAQENNKLLSEMARCSNLINGQARLACYDTVAEQMVSTTPYATGQNVIDEGAVDNVEHPTPIDTADFNEQEVVQRFGREASIRATEDGQQVLIDNVTGLKRIGPTKWLISLSSGQTWSQTIGKRFRLRKGDQVRVYPSSWGDSFRLSVEGRPGYIQVSRVE